MNHPLLVDVTGSVKPITFVIQTTGGYKQLYLTSQRFLKAVSNNPNITNVSSDLNFNLPVYHIDVNRKKATSLGVSMKQITDTLNDLFADPKIAWFSVDGFSYPVIPSAINTSRNSPLDLSEVNVRAANGELISLLDVANYHQTISSLTLNNFQGLHAATITATLANGYTLGQALKYLQHTAEKVLPGNMKYDYAGESRIFIQSSNMMVYIFLGCLGAIYLLLVIKFNSFIDPLLIMMSVPLSILGALIALYLAGYTLNIYTEIGLLMLMGLVSKHGIMMVSFANDLQEKGYTMRQAILDGAEVRLRPILMTTLAMVFGAIPLMLATGAGHESLQQIGIVIVAGLSFGSLLTLFMLPCLYLTFGKNIIKRKAKKGITI